MSTTRNPAACRNSTPAVSAAATLAVAKCGPGFDSSPSAAEPAPPVTTVHEGRPSISLSQASGSSRKRSVTFTLGAAEKLRLRGSQLLVPLDVAHEALLERELRLVAEELPRLVDRKRAALGHQGIALAMLDAYPGKMLARDLGHLVEGARAAVGQVEYLVLRFFPGDHQRDPRDEILDVGEIEGVAAVAVDGQVLSPQRVLYEGLPHAAADAALAVERGGSNDGIREPENLVVG